MASGNLIFIGLGCVLCLVVVLVIAWGLMTYNRLVRQRNQVDAAWAQIDVQLKRRYDLIPNLVETVKGYAAHERGTLDAVVQTRNSAITVAPEGPAARAQAENVLTQTLGRLFALAEAYPNLKANENFLGLQSELSGTEDKIAYARQFSESVRSAPGCSSSAWPCWSPGRPGPSRYPRRRSCPVPSHPRWSACWPGTGS